jgi:hypothetical protein
VGIHSQFAVHQAEQNNGFVADPAMSRRGSHIGDMLAFLIAATLWIKIRFVGEFLGSDIIALAAVPFIVSTRLGRLRSPFAKRFFILSGVGLVSLAATDFWRDTAFDDMLRGWSRNGLFLVSFFVLFTLMRGRPRRIVYFAVGLVVQGYLAFFVTPSDFARDEPWKFGLAPPTTLLILLTGIYLDRRRSSARWSLLAGLIAGSINIMMNYRSLGGICLVTALILLIVSSERVSSHKLPQPVLIVMVIVSIVGLLQLYGTLASSGVLGKAAESKYATQSSGRYGLIAGGRSESFGSFLAIYDSPFLGHGSWARDPKYQWAAKLGQKEAGYQKQGGGDEITNGGLIPMHSHLFGAWVEGGFAATLLWFWVFYRATRSLLVVARSPQLAALRIICCLSLMWDILFSPPGSSMRYVTVFNIVIVCAPDIFSKLPKRAGSSVPVFP